MKAEYISFEEALDDHRLTPIRDWALPQYFPSPDTMHKIILKSHDSAPGLDNMKNCVIKADPEYFA